MPIPLEFIPQKRTTKSPTIVQICPKCSLGMPLFKQNKRNLKLHESSNLLYVFIE